MWEIVHCEIISSIQCSWCFKFLDCFLGEGEYYYYVFNIVNKIIRSFTKINSIILEMKAAEKFIRIFLFLEFSPSEIRCRISYTVHIYSIFLGHKK